MPKLLLSPFTLKKRVRLLRVHWLLLFTVELHAKIDFMIQNIELNANNPLQTHL